MALGLAHTLYCDRPGCRSQITVVGTRSAAHAREVARRVHGWRTRQRDLCPNEAARAEIFGAPLALELAHDAAPGRENA